MNLQEEALKAVKDVPIGSLPELIKFARFLKTSHQEAIDKRMAVKDKKPVRQGGWVKGEIWMSDDFNDPLEFVSEDEMLVLEAMRAHKLEQSEIQEAAV